MFKSVAPRYVVDFKQIKNSSGAVVQLIVQHNPLIYKRKQPIAPAAPKN